MWGSYILCVIARGLEWDGLKVGTRSWGGDGGGGMGGMGMEMGREGLENVFAL